MEKCYIVYSSGIVSKFGRYSKGLNFTNGISIFNYEFVYIMSVNFLDINDMQNKQKIFYKLNQTRPKPVWHGYV